MRMGSISVHALARESATGILSILLPLPFPMMAYPGVPTNPYPIRLARCMKKASGTLSAAVNAIR